MQSRFSPLFASTALAAALILGWDLAGLDVVLARAMAGDGGFLLRDDWFLSTVMHSGAKYIAWAFEVVLCAMVVWPLGFFARLASSRRMQLATTVIVAAGLVSVLKSFSLTSCPWDLKEFGGLARHVSHWVGWFAPDGGGGRCFPAGHASSGFAFLGGYFAFRETSPKIADFWLASSLALGVALGLSQQLRGAHFLSHTLWTGWVCWVAAWSIDRLFAARVSKLGGAR